MNNAVLDALHGKLLVRLCLAVTTGLALAALLGWFLGIPSLATLGGGGVPMAPSTAVMFVLCAASVLVRGHGLSRRGTFWGGLVIGVAVVVLSLTLLITSSCGVYSEIEHIGLTIDHAPGEMPVGHMSPLTALCFLVVSMSHLVSLSSSPERAWRGVAAWWLACLLVLISVALVLAYLYGTPLLYGTSLIPPAAPTSLAFLSLGIALFVLIPHYPWLHRSDAAHGRQGAYTLVSVFVLLAAGIVVAGWLSFRHIERSYTAEVERQLSAVATLKVSDLVQWRKERLGDGSVFHRNRTFSEWVDHFFESPNDPDARSGLQTWMAQVQAAYRYERVFLLDNQGRERISVPDTPESPKSQILQVLPGIFQSRQVAFVDFHRDAPDTPIHLSIAVPIFGGSNDITPVAVLVLRVNPEVYLYPLVSRWPTPSQTAETLLVRREGDEVVFLNELRFTKGVALNLRFPISQTDLPAVKAVLGQEGIVEGRDYRGVAMLAYVCGIPDSPWFLVARMDLSEVYAPLREKLFVLVGFVCSLLLTAAAVVGMLWRRHTAIQYKERYEAAELLRRQEERYHQTLDDMMEGCQILDYDWHYLYINDAAARYAGRTKTELLGRTMMECYPDIEKTALFGELRRCMNERATHFMENESTYADGTKAWFDLSIQPVPEGLFILSIDITQRKRAEERLRYLAEVLRAVRNVNQLITHEKDRDTLLRRACEILTETRGFRSAWIATLDGAGQLRAAAESGIGARFADLRSEIERGIYPECCRLALDCPDVVVMHNTESNCVKCPVAHFHRDTAALAHQLSHAGCVYGVLEVAIPAVMADDPEEQSLFRELAGDISYALYAIETERKRQRAVELLATRSRVADILQTVPDDEMYNEVLKVVLDAMRSPFGVFGYLDEDGALVVPTMTRQVWDRCQVAEKTVRFPRETWGNGSWPRAIRERKANFSNRPSTEVPQGHVAITRHISLPIVFRNEVVGLFQVANKDTDYTDTDVRDLQDIADYIAPLLVARSYRDRAQEALRASEERCRALVESAPDAIVVYGEHGVLYANSVAIALCGLDSFERLRERGILGVIHPDERTEVAERMRKGLGGEGLPVRETRLIRPDGTEVYVETVGRAVDFDGVPAVQVFIRDITERKWAEGQLRKLSVAVTQSPVVVVITDIEGNIEYVNPRFTEVTGYSVEEVLGRNPRILKSGDTPQEEYDRLWKTIRSGREWRGEFHNKRKDGSLFWERAFIGPIRDGVGAITHFIAIKEEITQQKKLEEQYLQAQKMEAVGQLAGGIAHDFNNILQAMVGYGSLLLDRLPDQDETREFAEEIVRGTERASALTRQLLAFSRRQVLEMEDLDLNEVVRGVMKMIQRIIGEDIAVKMLEGERLGFVHADRGQIEQVLLNLCVNARDAMPDGGTLTIETEKVLIDGEYCSAHAWATPGQYALLSVTDTGCGMDAETQARVFEPFFTTKEQGKGTGLGLATVYGIVRQHQGMVQVYSEAGKGTTLKVYLPTVEHAKTVRRARTTARARGGAETILIVEDDDTGRKLAARILESAGYTVLLASNGEEALDVIEKHGGGIHLLLLDVIMPKMGGKAVYNALAQRHPNLRFLFASGYSANVMPTGVTPEEGIELIQKPYAPDDLLRKIRQVLDEAIEEKGSGRRTTP